MTPHPQRAPRTLGRPAVTRPRSPQPRAHGSQARVGTRRMGASTPAARFGVGAGAGRSRGAARADAGPPRCGGDGARGEARPRGERPPFVRAPAARLLEGEKTEAWSLSNSFEVTKLIQPVANSYRLCISFCITCLLLICYLLVSLKVKRTNKIEGQGQIHQLWLKVP
ncbi:CYFIP-related Rac1 interactor B isoform X7 [Nycticebus coucang]|uniref:CYFIP-related Rac1 interactor B isoform X7 n=1 Tax=Nycticebus coucang TaxID=9470 RepID=UPI00234DE36E|nr:CYFIP-related Rac1 interactor B isoform X7 [Nycticebus coucang]